MSQPPTSPPPEPAPYPGAQPPPGAAHGVAPTGWEAPPPPSWAPLWSPSGPPVPPAPAGGPPAGTPTRPTGPLLLAAGGGLLAGLLGSGLVVAALFTVGAEDIGETMADRIGAAVEAAIVEGTRVATEESLDGLGAFPEDLYHGGGPVEAPEQFPPAPPEALGPDPVLDGYARDCFGGALQACDDLLYESPPMSAYEEYASTCGGRVTIFSVASCTELE